MAWIITRKGVPFKPYMELITLTGKNIQDAAKKAAAALKKGGIVIYPTDTIYGIGVAADNEDAIERLKNLKGRERKKPISVIVPDVKRMEECGELTPLAKKFAEAHLPGPLTLVIPARNHISPSIMLNGAVGVRIPKEEFCLALAKEFGRPFTTTSANKSGMGTPRTAEEILRHFSQELPQIAVVIDGGPRSEGRPSTVVSCVGDTPYVLREGALSRTELGL
jgi:L-threonylcarbamoyladenylate synthase